MRREAANPILALLVPKVSPVVGSHLNGKPLIIHNSRRAIVRLPILLSFFADLFTVCARAEREWEPERRAAMLAFRLVAREGPCGSDLLVGCSMLGSFNQTRTGSSSQILNISPSISCKDPAGW